LNMEYLSDVYPSEDLRRVLIEILLLSSTDYLTLNHLIISLMSSKSTIVNDLKIVRKSLASNQLVLRNNRNRGYFVEGDESVIRYRLLKLTMQFLHQDNGEMFLNDFVQRCYQIDGGKVIEDITQLCNNYD
ncbi:helix-turn-helix domain-containing protein, partial [Enterococcus cecorum]